MVTKLRRVLKQTYRNKGVNCFVYEENMKKAIMDVSNNLETPTSASRKHGVSRTTILSRIAKLKKDGEDRLSSCKLAPSDLLTSDQEEELAELIKLSADSQQGLTPLGAQKMVFEYVNKNLIRHPNSWTNRRMASQSWVLSFLRRNPGINLNLAPQTYGPKKLKRAQSPTYKPEFESTAPQNITNPSVDVKKELEPELIINSLETIITTGDDTMETSPLRELTKIFTSVQGNKEIEEPIEVAKKPSSQTSSRKMFRRSLKLQEDTAAEVAKHNVLLEKQTALLERQVIAIESTNKLLKDLLVVQTRLLRR